MSNYTLYSGIDTGSGLVDTYDEGYILKYDSWDGFEWTTAYEIVNDATDPTPTVGGSPDFGHSAVGFIDDDGSGNLNVEWRAFWRFDLYGIDLANVISARLVWRRDGSQAWAGFSNDIKKARFEAGYNITGGQLRQADWGRTYPYLLGDLPWTSWGASDNQFSLLLPDMGVFRDNAGGSPRFDVRIMLTGYVPEDTGIRADLTSGDNAHHAEPWLEVGTESAFLAQLRGAVHSGDVGARVTAGALQSAVQSGAAAVRVGTGAVGARVRSAALTLMVEDR